ncbi:MAG: DNA polymerase III subunit gamma/tau, partial [Lentisphaeria bacterium]|nr:DNA polymerase III subunit gamma/tau [Lentisphaeria bacterium]
MAYQVTARKWRPQRFSDMVGQEHIARTLKNAIRTGHIAHAYLFVGPRGIGKTTSARIFAKALNCKRPVDGESCCECSSCKSIADETNVDIIEIDAATHTQVDKAREICEDVLHLPIASKYKIYIIDEVHMLSKSAWNALLKTIEEPPAHAKFIFATTEVNKVLPTVISRCQRFDLRRIPSELIAQRLSYIAHEEKINISPSAINVIARAADGGMRDAQSLLDQLVSFFGTNAGNEEISEAQALSLFGLTAPEEMEELLNSILNNDRAAAILSIHKFAEQGKNLETLFEEVLAWLRGIMLSIILPNPQSVLDENPEKILIYQKLATDRNVNMVQTLLEQLSASSYLLREAINKQIFIETIMLKSMRSAHAVRIEDLLVRLNQIRRNGELDVLAKVPSLAQMPVAQTAPAVHPQVAQTAPPVQIPVTSPSQPVPSQIPHPQVAQTSPQPQVRQTPAPAVPAALVPQMEKPVEEV